MAASEHIDLLDFNAAITLPRRQVRRVLAVENRGLDAGPVWTCLRSVDLTKYLAVTILHTKRSAHHACAQQWREDLLQAVGGSPETVQRNLRLMETDASVGIIGAANWLAQRPHGTYPALLHTLGQLGLQYREASDQHVSGTIFTIRAALLRSLYEATRELPFENIQSLPPAQRKHSTYAHAVERAYGILCLERGFRLVGV